MTDLNKNDLHYGDDYEVSSATSRIRASISSTRPFKSDKDYNVLFVKQRGEGRCRGDDLALVTALAMLRPTSADPYLGDD